MQLVDRLVAGDRRALARVITLVENGAPEARTALTLLFPRSGHAATIGVTGGAGTGKSTLVNQLAKEFRRRGKTVGIIAVDPSSPFTQGAILGDRVRMQDLASDHGIFIRSMATRGSLGGLAETTGDVLTVLDAAGRDVVMVETVGAGQDEVEVCRATQTTIVITIPGSGDDIQAMKAGILEIADVLVVNKADREGADTLASQLNALLSLAPRAGWQVPVLQTVATEGRGITELAQAIEDHQAHLRTTGKLERDARDRVRYQLLTLARQELMQRILHEHGANGSLERLVEAVLARDIDPHTAARRLIDAG